MGILSSEHKSFMVVDFGGLKGVLTCNRSRGVGAWGAEGSCLNPDFAQIRLPYLNQGEQIVATTILFAPWIFIPSYGPEERRKGRMLLSFLP